MELNMFCATPNETILNELYGWGEIPFDWIADRVAEFNTQHAEVAGKPVVMTSVLDISNEDDWEYLFIVPVEPKVGVEHTMVENIMRRVKSLPSTLFRLECTHDGVRCIAFM